MARRTFDEDFGVVSEAEEFGCLMGVMEGRRSDYARIKSLKSNGLYERVNEAVRLYGDVYHDWLAVYGSPKEKEYAKGKIAERNSKA